ncbi:hypothetical protein ACE1AT_28010 [Pelatocladus sp. BLCC-F211]|uniref:hypothetical protein n=1 Tax=Pelatocladus sp. BLCC-F211 TaxID=3342752 RepID=UPI0035B80C28
MQHDPGDSRLNHYFLEHSFQVLTNRDYVGELFSPAFFYPYKNVLAFSDNLFGSAPIYFILRAFFSPDLSYQLWMILACVLCFVSFAILMRHYQVKHVPTVIGAFLFAFGIPRIAQIAHQQLLPQFFTPLAFLFAWDFLKNPRNKSFAWSLLLVYLQVLAGIYLGWFLIFTLIIFSAIVYILDSDKRQRLIKYIKYNNKPVILIVATWLLFMLALLAPYLQIQKIVGGRDYTEIDTMLPRLSSWFLPASNSLWWTVFSENSKNISAPGEHQLFSGFLIIFLTVLSIYTLKYRKNIILDSERSLLIKSCLFVALTIFSVTLRLPNGWSLWAIIYKVLPGASVIRAVTRICLIFYFFLLVAVTLCLDSWQSKVLNRRLCAITISLLSFGCVLEQIIISPPSFAIAPLKEEVAQIRKLMKKDCDVAYVTLKTEKLFIESQVSAMWAGLKANVPVINGYSGNVPPDYGDMSYSMDTAKVIKWLGEDTKGRLCIISQQLLKDKDKLIYMYSNKENTSPSGNWTSYQINLPISKNFVYGIQEIKGD